MFRILVLFAVLIASVVHAEGGIAHNPCECHQAVGKATDYDEYLQGYLQGLIDMYYHDYRVQLKVRGSTVYLSHLPCNCLIARSIVRFLQDFPGISCVYIDRNCCVRPKPRLPLCRPGCGVAGIWFPQNSLLFQPLVADPRQITFSAAWRFHDDIAGTGLAAVSYGNRFPFFRWLDVGSRCIDIQLELEGGVWAIFRLDKEMETDNDAVALINSDWYVGIPLTAAYCNWSYRLRFYHVSSHLGDEFMVNHPEVTRLNPSREAIDFFVSYQLTQSLRIYGGIGVNLHSNETFEVKPLYAEYGAELRVLGCRNRYHCLYFQPFLAMHFANWEDVRWRFDATYAAGVEVSALEGWGRKWRLFLEYHDGYSLEGQFSNLRTNYLAVRTSWGF